MSRYCQCCGTRENLVPPPTSLIRLENPRYPVAKPKALTCRPCASGEHDEDSSWCEFAGLKLSCGTWVMKGVS